MSSLITIKPLLQLEGDRFQKGRKHCHKFSYSLIGGLELKTATIAFSFLQQQLFSNRPPVVLKVYFKGCPAGYETNSNGQCDCQGILKSYKIECNLHSKDSFPDLDR